MSRLIFLAFDPGTVAQPVCSPLGGSFALPQGVTISTTTTGASIYYTTDGSTPSSASTLYTGALTAPAGATTTIKSIGIKSQWENSTVASETYIVAAGVVVVVPASGITTTAAAIRDRIYTVIEGLTPSRVSGDRFERYLNELGADFEAWAEAHSTGARRRFQVRRDGGIPAAAVSNNDIEERQVTFRILVAYPQLHRDGPDNAMDRDDSIDADQNAIERAIGMCGRANFTQPLYPDACWREQSLNVSDSRGNGVDFLEMTITYSYMRALT